MHRPVRLYRVKQCLLRGAVGHTLARRAQLTDIAQWGSAEDTARLLLPRGARLLSAAAAAVPQPPRDTGTPAGLVQPPPCTVYRRARGQPGRRRGSLLVRVSRLLPDCVPTNGSQMGASRPRTCSSTDGCRGRRAAVAAAR
jgi:hypothetical protein